MNYSLLFYLGAIMLFALMLIIYILKNRIANGKNITINLLLFKLCVYQDKENVKRMLADKNALLSYPNHNFNVASGLYLGLNRFSINNMNSTDIMWQILHKSLVKGVDSLIKDGLVDSVLDRHMHILFSNYEDFSLNETVAKFVLNVWSEICYGINIDHKKYQHLRKRLLNVLRYTFYDTSTHRYPIIGRLVCWYKSSQVKDELCKLSHELYKLNSRDCVNGGIHEGLFDRLRMFLSKDGSFGEAKIEEIIKSNTFTAVLVYDFIHNILLDYLVHKSKNNEHELNESINKSFLFPFRFRKIGNGVGMSFNILNLKSAKLYFSHGSRSCVGRKLFQNVIIKKIDDQMKIMNYEPSDDNKITYLDSYDFPIITSKHSARFTFRNDYIKEIIPSYEWKKIKKFYNLTLLTENQILNKYMVNWMNSVVKLAQKLVKVDAIVSIEARGYLFAGALAYNTNLPLICVRKENKIPGPTFKMNSFTKYCKSVLEISQDSNIIGKNVVIIDDGIASAGTLFSTAKLIEKSGGKVVKIIVPIKHMYTKTIKEYKEYESLTNSLFII
jgi:adenine phosphoribosyltransferase